VKYIMRDQTNNKRTPTDDDHPSGETDKQSDKAACRDFSYATAKKD
jgi:hypothetical protein